MRRAVVVASVVAAGPAAATHQPADKIGVSADGPGRLVVRLLRPLPWLPELLAHPAASPRRMDRPADGRVSSGAFRFAERVPGSHLLLMRNRHYREAAQVAIDQVRYLPIADHASELSRYRAGELDMSYTAPVSRVPWLKERMPDEFRVAPYLALYFYGFNTRRPPLDDVRVRQALSLAIDRKQVIEHIMNGRARLPHPFATFPYTDYYSADRWEKWAAEAYRYDPALAKKILAEEGYPNGFELKFANTALPGTQFMIDIGHAIADMWTKAGVKVALKHYEWGSFPPMERGDQAQLTGWASMYRTAGRPDIPWRYDGAFSPESDSHLIGEKGNCDATCEKFVETYRTLLAERDPKKRTALTDKMVEESKKLLDYLGIPAVQAPSDGEAAAAYLTKHEIAFASASQDYDSILFGAKRLVRNLAISGRRKVPNRNAYVDVEPEIFEHEKVLKEIGLSHEQLVDVGILIGTDFNPGGFQGIGPKTALKLIKESGRLENVEKIKHLLPDVPYAEIRKIFLEPDEPKVGEIRFGPVDREKVLDFLCVEKSFSADRVSGQLDRVHKTTQNRSQSLEQWFG